MPLFTCMVGDQWVERGLLFFSSACGNLSDLYVRTDPTYKHKCMGKQATSSSPLHIFG